MLDLDLTQPPFESVLVGRIRVGHSGESVSPR